MATTWPSVNEINAYNDGLITGNTIPTKNHLILLEDFFRLNPKQLEIKLREKRWMPSPSNP
jgi:hypothetical protein